MKVNDMDDSCACVVCSLVVLNYNLIWEDHARTSIHKSVYGGGGCLALRAYLELSIE
jgi:hypothetical protein